MSTLFSQVAVVTLFGQAAVVTLLSQVSAVKLISQTAGTEGPKTLVVCLKIADLRH